MRKILSLVLVLSLVLGSMSMAFAAAPSFSDVEDEAVLKAVQRLNAFGIVDGYEDGSFKPGKDITRAEFAKLLVTALGLENAADAATGVSQFNDVAGNEWYAGSVAVAAGQGLVKGYADGTYRPNSEVKYSEAITMLVRALGYKDEFLPGMWPNNYIAKAASLDITNDVKFQPNGFADRGSVAVLVNNTLDANIIEQESYGDNDDWVENDHKTLLTERLTLDKYESIELTETPKVESGLDADQVKFEETNDSKMNGYDEDDFKLPSSFEVKDAEQLNQLETRLGESLNVYVDDDEIVYFETSDNASTVKWGTILSGDVDTDEKEITVTFVDGDDKTYDYDDDDVVLYVDNEETDHDELKGDLFGKVVIADNGDVALADLHKWDDEALIVTDSSADEFDYIAATDSHKTFEADDFDKVVVMNTAGQIMSMKDLQEDTVVYVNEASLAESGDDVAYVVAVETPAVVETADDYDVDDDDEEEEFKTEESGTYDINADYGTVSADEDDDIVDFGDASDELESMTGSSAKVKILFDIVKDIRHISSDVDVSSTNLYGIVIGTADDKFDSDEVQIKMLTAEEDKVVYDIDFDSDEFLNLTDKAFKGDAPSDIDEGDLIDLCKGLIVKYTLNSDSEIDSMVVVNHDLNNNDSITESDKLEANSENDVDKSDLIVASGKLSEDIEKDSIEFSSTNFEGGKDGIKDFTVASDVIVFDVTGTDADDMDVIKFDNLVGNGDDKQILVVANDDEEAELIVVTNEVASDTEYVGYLLETRQKDDTHYFEIAVFGEKDTKKYEVDTDSVKENKISEDTIVVFNIKSDDTINIIGASDEAAGAPLPSSSDFDFVVGQVVDVDGNWLKIDTDADRSYDDKVKIDNNTLMYEDSDEDADVDEYDFVLVAKDGTKAKVVKRYDISYEDYDEDDDDEKQFAKDLKSIEGVDSSDIDGFYFGDGDTPNGGSEGEEGTVTYVNSDASRIYVDGEVYKLDEDTELYDADGKLLEIGNDDIKDRLVKDETKVEIKKVRDGIVKELAIKDDDDDDDNPSGGDEDALTSSDVSTKEGAVAGLLAVKVDFPTDVTAVTLKEVDGTTTNAAMEDGKYKIVPGTFDDGNNSLTFEYVEDGETKTVTIEK